MEAARAMLHDQDIAMHLWEEETKTTIYVENCTPHLLLDNKTPKEDFLGDKPEVSHLKISDFSMYIHILKEKRTKLDPSGRKGIFLGYNDTLKSYQIYFPGFKKININRDVNFDEDSTYFRFRRTPIQEVEEPKEIRGRDMEIEESIPKNHEDHNMIEPQEKVETFLDKDSHKRKLAWARELIREAERYSSQ